MKEIILLDKVWITKEDWDACHKFEEDQKQKLYEFMYKQYDDIKGDGENLIE